MEQQNNYKERLSTIMSFYDERGTFSVKNFINFIKELLLETQKEYIKAFINNMYWGKETDNTLLDNQLKVLSEIKKEINNDQLIKYITELELGKLLLNQNINIFDKHLKTIIEKLDKKYKSYYTAIKEKINGRTQIYLSFLKDLYQQGFTSLYPQLLENLKNKVILEDITKPENYIYLGKYYLKKGNIEKAEIYFSKSINYNENSILEIMKIYIELFKKNNNIIYISYISNYLNLLKQKNNLNNEEKFFILKTEAELLEFSNQKAEAVKIYIEVLTFANKIGYLKGIEHIGKKLVKNLYPFLNQEYLDLLFQNIPNNKAIYSEILNILYIQDGNKIGELSSSIELAVYFEDFSHILQFLENLKTEDLPTEKISKIEEIKTQLKVLLYIQPLSLENISDLYSLLEPENSEEYHVYINQLISFYLQKVTSVNIGLYFSLKNFLLKGLEKEKLNQTKNTFKTMENEIINKFIQKGKKIKNIQSINSIPQGFPDPIISLLIKIFIEENLTNQDIATIYTILSFDLNENEMDVINTGNKTLTIKGNDRFYILEKKLKWFLYQQGKKIIRNNQFI